MMACKCMMVNGGTVTPNACLFWADFTMVSAVPGMAYLKSQLLTLNIVVDV